MPAPADVLVINASNAPIPVTVERSAAVDVTVINSPQAPVPTVSPLPPIFTIGANVARIPIVGPVVDFQLTNGFEVIQIHGEWALLRAVIPNPPGGTVDTWFHIPSTSPWRKA